LSISESCNKATLAYKNLGVIYQRQGRLKEALQELEKAIQLDPNYAEAQKSLQEVQRQLGR